MSQRGLEAKAQPQLAGPRHIQWVTPWEQALVPLPPSHEACPGTQVVILWVIVHWGFPDPTWGLECDPAANRTVVLAASSHGAGTE